MQFVVPRIILVVLSAVIAVFCYYESLYYYDHALSLGESASGVRSWMWVFRLISLSSLVFAVFVTFSLIRKLFS